MRDFLYISLFIFFTSAQLFAAPAGRMVQEAVEIAAKVSGRTLTPAAGKAAQRHLAKAFMKYGDDALTIARHGGLEALRAGAKYGDDFWKIAKNVSPAAARSISLHADELMPVVRRMGDDFLKLETKVPGLGLKTVTEFGDDAAITLARNASADDITRLLGYAAKADSPAAKRALLEAYTAKGSKFLDHLNWKHIMAAGLSVSAVTAAYKLSDGVEEGLKKVAENDPDTFREIIDSLTAPVRWSLWILAVLLLTPLFFKTVRNLKLKKNSRTTGKSSDPGRDD